MSAPDAAAANRLDARLDWEDDKSVLDWMENKVRDEFAARFCEVCRDKPVVRSIWWRGTQVDGCARRVIRLFFYMFVWLVGCFFFYRAFGSHAQARDRDVHRVASSIECFERKRRYSRALQHWRLANVEEILQRSGLVVAKTIRLCTHVPRPSRS